MRTVTKKNIERVDTSILKDFAKGADTAKLLSLYLSLNKTSVASSIKCQKSIQQTLYRVKPSQRFLGV